MIKEIKSKTALSPSQLPGLDYALNPYIGCGHACIYCYAPSVIHRDEGKWGDVAERKYEVTRRCLELLLMHDFPVCIQTKSSLVLRDMDLLKKFSDTEVGITLTALDDRVRERMEPGASSVEERLHALEELRENGINTWVFLSGRWRL